MVGKKEMRSSRARFPPIRPLNEMYHDLEVSGSLHSSGSCAGPDQPSLSCIVKASSFV